MFELTPFSRRNHKLSTYNPFQAFDELEKEFFGNNSLSEFKTDIKDTGSAYELEADLPGFKKEDIHIDIDDNYLTISAQRHSEMEQKDQKGNFIRCERSFGSFERSFDISGVKTEDIKAEYKDGVLKLTMPKTQEEKTPNRRRLDIE